ncbi:MAG: hypothetical protein NW207_09675 [Cytophagales bacterium]|nr:hypothetical protein [Cytophagales bacterium]
MKNTYILLSVLCVSLLCSCGAQYAKVKIEDARPKDEYVYGDVNGAPRQLKNTYGNTTPESAEIAATFRKQVESNLVSAK